MDNFNPTTDDELVSLEEISLTEDAGQPDLNPNATSDEELVGLEEFYGTEEEVPTPEAQESNQAEAVSERTEQVQKSLLDYVMEMAMQSLMNNNTEQAAEQTSEETSEPKQEATAKEPQDQTQQEQTVDENKLPKTVQELLEEAKRIVFESRAMEYARQQAQAIQKEVSQLATLGIRVSNEEVQDIIQNAIANGIEPIQAFKSYAYELVKIGAVTGTTPTRLRQPIARPQTPVTRVPTAPRYAARAEGEFIPLEDVILETFEEE
jgi:DNA primase